MGVCNYYRVRRKLVKTMVTQRIISFPLAGLVFAAVCFTTGCSPAAYSSSEGIVGGLIGSAMGSGVGAYFGSVEGNMTKNILANAAIGGGLGLLGGSMMYENNLQLERQREVVVREAEMIDKNQRELDLSRERLYDSTSWGGNDSKPWNERYPAEDLELPYQGPSQYLRPGSPR